MENYEGATEIERAPNWGRFAGQPLRVRTHVVDVAAPGFVEGCDRLRVEVGAQMFGAREHAPKRLGRAELGPIRIRVARAQHGLPVARPSVKRNPKRRRGRRHSSAALQHWS